MSRASSPGRAYHRLIREGIVKLGGRLLDRAPAPVRHNQALRRVGRRLSPQPRVDEVPERPIGAKLELTSLEYKLLEYLMLHAGEVLSKTQITEALYSEDFERDSNVIEVFIGRLRRKLDPDNTYKPIETLRGRGYRFALERKKTD